MITKEQALEFLYELGERKIADLENPKGGFFRGA